MCSISSKVEGNVYCKRDGTSTEDCSFSLKIRTLKTWLRERVPACSRRKNDDMTIHTMLRALARDRVVIGSKDQSLTASLGHCLARFEAPLTRRPEKAPVRHRAYEFSIFATPFRTNNLSSAAVLNTGWA